MNTYDVITIGSGIGGLLASTLLAQQGKKVLLLEQHSLPGGYCTSYQRKGFTFDIPSVFTGHDSNNNLGKVLDALGFREEIEWVKIENFAKCVFPDLEIVFPSNNLDGCRENLVKTFPTEKGGIDRLFAMIAKIDPSGLLNPRATLGQKLSGLASVLRLSTMGKLSFYDYARRFTRNEHLISVLAHSWAFMGLPPKRLPAAALAMFGNIISTPLWFPLDGYQSISNFLARKLQTFGGEIRYSTNVNKILVKDGRAVGVETECKGAIFSRTIISNADTKKTFLELVGREHLPSRFVSKINAHRHSESCLSLQIGTHLDVSRLDLKYGQIFYHETWEDDDAFFDKAANNRLDFLNDPIQYGLQAPSLLSDRLTPESMHSLHMIIYPVSRTYLNHSRMTDGRCCEQYHQVKKDLVKGLIRKLERIVPGLSSAIVVQDLSTPYTFERYTSASGGAIYDSVTAAGEGLFSVSVRTPIQNLFLSGTKAFGGCGLGCALQGGLEAAKVAGNP
jgi:all-trans-retinol 13,14-reductase